MWAKEHLVLTAAANVSFILLRQQKEDKLFFLNQHNFLPMQRVFKMQVHLLEVLAAPWSKIYFFVCHKSKNVGSNLRCGALISVFVLVWIL